MSPIEDLARLIPHQGAMCLNERVLEWDQTRIRLATTTHCAERNPLRHRGRLHAVHLAEYGAQAMAVHGALLAQSHGAAARPGLLVSLRAVRFHVQRIDDLPGELVIEGERLMAGEDSAQYRFEIRHQDRLLAEGRAAVILRAAS
jgi:predicted hotdog family 3-hydroxylacyl-ACP dehydratase